MKVTVSDRPTTMVELGEWIGVTQKTLRHWRSTGIYIWSDDAVRAFIKGLPRTPPKLTNRFYPHPPVTAAQLVGKDTSEVEPESEYRARLERERAEVT